MFSYSLTKVRKEVLLAVCDLEILGRTLDEEMRFQVSESFYGGRKCSEDMLAELIEEATIINAVGSNIIRFLVEKGYVEEDKVIRVGGVPHAQVVTV